MASAAAFGIPSGQAPASPRARLWRVLRFCHTPRSLAQLYAAADIEPELFFSLIDAWSARGFLLTEINPLRFIMTNAARERKAAPRSLSEHSGQKRKSSVPKRSGRQRLWAAMRVLKEFDLKTLCLAAEAGEKGATEFIYALARTGYLDTRPTPRGDDQIWRLLRNTGPAHPIVRRRNRGSSSLVEVEDRNSGQTYHDELDFSPRSARLGKSPSDNGGVS